MTIKQRPRPFCFTWTLGVLAALILGGGFMAAPARASAAPRPPNVLVILSDDIGWGDFGCYNPRGKIPTPHIDRLAQQGMQFTNAHTPTGLCSPTRYCMLTGNYAWRGRSPGGTWGLDMPSQILPGQKTLA